MKLLFGKYKDENVTDVPACYLWWLTCWELDNDTVKSVWANFDGETWKEKISDFLEEAPNCAHKFLIRKYLSVVWKARQLFKHRRYCAWCNTVMPHVGHSRSGGANHPDWNCRILHKKCWLEVKD